MTSKRFSTTIEIEFLGYEGLMAPSNMHNKKKIRDEAQKEGVRKYFEAIQWYNNKKNEIVGDKDPKDYSEEDLDKMSEINEKFKEKSDPYEDDLIEYRKNVLNIIVKEWKGEEPPEEIYTDEYWDNWAFAELQNFFSNPNPTLSEKQ